MDEISILKIGNDSYAIKDATARTSSSNANTKIDGAEITGTYTAGTETLEISLTLGSVQ